MSDRYSSFVIAGLGTTAVLLSGFGGRCRAALVVRPVAVRPAVRPKIAVPSTNASNRPASYLPGTQPAETPPILANLKPYSVDANLSPVANRKSFERSVLIDPGQRQILAQQLFVCRSTVTPQLFQIYEKNDDRNVPSFVTADLMLHTYHVFYDDTLRTIEARSLLPAVKTLTQGMLARSLNDWKSATKPDVKLAALKNIAFFGVAAHVLGMKDAIPAAAQGMVERESALITAHRGFAVGAIFPYNIDYSQFVPRGHYTRSADLKQYFRGLMWYGLAPFAIHYVDSSEKKRRSDETIRQGLLLSHDLTAPAVQKEWESIYEPTAFYVGAADDVTPAEWESASKRVYGAGGTIDKFADPARLDAFAAAVDAAHAAGIRARFGRASRIPADVPQVIPSPRPIGIQLRFMGQRYIPDSAIMQRLTAPERRFPSGLDVMAVLGSDRASRILDEYPRIYNSGGWKDYIPERRKLTAEFATVPAAVWRSNLYWSWLDTLRTLNRPAPAGFPSFMKSDAWLDRSLSTSLGSWAELRHDTILYAKQSYKSLSALPLRSVVHGYVEPDVAVYRRLLALTRQSQTGLAARGYLTPELKDHFERFIELLNFLDTTSEKELRGEKLTELEYSEIRNVGGRAAGLMLFSEGGHPTSWHQAPESDRDMAVVADVHTGGVEALEEGVGHADDILVIVPVDGKLELARGAIFTYYEFKHPISDRMTDEAWRTMLKSAGAPLPPVWTKSLFSARPAGM